MEAEDEQTCQLTPEMARISRCAQVETRRCHRRGWPRVDPSGSPVLATHCLGSRPRRRELREGEGATHPDTGSRRRLARGKSQVVAASGAW